jgi:hypothetical protein
MPQILNKVENIEVDLPRHGRECYSCWRRFVEKGTEYVELDFLTSVA